MTEAEELLADFIRILRGNDVPLDPGQLAESLWLAQHLPSAPVDPRPRKRLRKPPLVTPPVEPPPPAAVDPARAPAELPPPSPLTVEPEQGRVYIDTPGGGGAGSVPFRAAGASALPRSLQIARSIRPLMMRVPSRIRRSLDEVATAEGSAERGTVVAVLRPSPERLLDLALIVDRGGSMSIFAESLTELTRLLERQGAFRNVRSWDVVDRDGQPLLIRATSAKTQSARSPNELIDPSGRRLIAIVSDCVSEAWVDGRMASLARRWAERGPVVVFQLLPRTMWNRTGLRAAPAMSLRAAVPAAANRSLRRTPWREGARLPKGVGVPVPVVALDPSSLQSWARVVAAVGGATTSGVLLRENPRRDLLPEPEPAMGTLPAEVRVNEFNAVSSPGARRLARLLAVTPYPLTLPVMRIVQQVMMPESDLNEAAEVYLGGLLHVVSPSDDPEKVEYAFSKEVRGLRSSAQTARLPGRVPRS